MKKRFELALLSIGFLFAGAPARAMIAPSATLGCPAPAATRAWVPPQIAPLWAVDSSGEPIDVVNLYLHGPRELAEAIFSDQGWTLAMDSGVSGDVAYVLGVAVDGIEGAAPGGIGNWIVQRMPVSAESVCGRPMEDALERDNDPLGGRDHFRLFLAGVDEQGRSVWALSASRDTAIRVDLSRPRQLFLNHASEPNEDLERDRILQSLESDSAIDEMRVLQLQPTGYARDNGAYSADGRVYDIVIR